ncbi:hypothetical protein PG996_007904 [Apiospora saccharicola]|uniref:Rhodopsin domain-containing protein n=1 Tax=Apiospora saccharicola TaxID=335842 RepID=A0ABR1UWG6_9PEZI
MDDEYSFPTARSFLGDVIVTVGAVMLALDTLFVSMRLYGRRRYSKMPRRSTVSYGEPRYWVVVSDAAIVISYMCAAALVAVEIYAVRCGEGLHMSQLTVPQQVHKAKVLYIYTVLYKFFVPIPKIATVFLLLAIAPPHLRAFIATCKLVAAYMGLYCLATTLVAIFQCGPDVANNWLRMSTEVGCVDLPTFWYAQFAIDISACVIMIGLPWWLFASRKNVIATVLSTLAIGETILAATSLWLMARTLAEAVKPNPDVTRLECLNLIVSQLHINFGCIAACVPTVLKLFEEGWVALGGRIKCIERTLGTSQQKSQSSSARRSTAIHLSALKSAERGATGGGDNNDGRDRSKTPVVVGPYLNPECDDDDGSMGSQQRIISNTGGGNIQVQTEVSISVETDRGGTYSEDNGSGDGHGHGHGHGRLTSSAFRG